MDPFYGFSSLEYILEECPPISDFDKVCRICLSRSDLHSIFRYCGDSTALPQDLSAVVLHNLNVKVNINDSLPDKICQKCVDVLKVLIHVKQLSENTEERLKHALELETTRKDLLQPAKVENDAIDLKNEISDLNLRKFVSLSYSKDEIMYEYDKNKVENDASIMKRSKEKNDIKLLQKINIIIKPRIPVDSSQDIMFKCIRCLESFSHKAGLERHLISKHGKLLSVRSDPSMKTSDWKALGDSKKRSCGHPCKKCSKVFKSERGLLKHSTMYHPWFSLDSSGKALCPNCGEAIGRKHIVGHMMAHQKSYKSNTYIKLPENKSESEQTTCDETLIVQPPEDSQLSGETTQLSTLFNEVADGKVVCKLCHYEYGRKNILRHIRGHLKDMPLSVNTFKVQTIDESQPFIVNMQGKAVCKLCGNTYHRKYILRHVRTHLKRTRTCKITPIVKKKSEIPAENATFFECLSCERSFPYRGGLDQHMVSEHGKLFSCYWCQQVFKFRKSKYRHMKLACSNRPTGSFSCKDCPSVFNTLKMFTIHVDRQHVPANSTKELKRLFGCGECKSTFTSTSSFKAHMLIHLNVRTLCTICGKRCGPNSLNSHMKTHAERTIKCEQCPYRTNLQNNLKIHLRSHSGEKPYACELCPHRSVNMSNLYVHQLTHSGLRRFQCSECGNKYNNKRLLVDHINFVHRKLRLNVCSYCNKSYGSSKHVRRHIKTVHPLECKNIKSSDQ